MLKIKYLFFIILLHSIIATPQINLYFTDRISDNTIQQDCLRVVAAIDQLNVNRQIMSYCMSESLSKYTIQNNSNHFRKFTFAELSKENISSQQLYSWSASIDLIEDYQFYLNELTISNDSSLETKIFYNCTLPRFGSICQYEFDYYHRNYLSLYHMIRDFYYSNKYQPSNLTCYKHLECNRGPDPSCLDWSEICDGKVDCHDRGFDEEHCWQMEMNECEENEYRCMNGQCIPQTFYLDDGDTPDCLDQSDQHPISYRMRRKCNTAEPSFGCEDVTCNDTFLTSSCMDNRQYLLLEAMYSMKDNSSSDECWSAFRCLIDMPDSTNYTVNLMNPKKKVCIRIVQATCPDMLYIPSVPIFFDHVYLAYTKDDSRFLGQGGRLFPYICYNNSRYDNYFINATKVLFNSMSCFRPKKRLDLEIFSDVWDRKYHEVLYLLYKALLKYTMISKYTSEICKKSSMYQCIGSPKCISIDRFLNGIDDCPRSDDEDMTGMNNAQVIERVKQSYFKCQASNKYIPQSLIADNKCDCGEIEPGWCEDEDQKMNYIKRNISFQTICDKYTELHPVIIDGRKETDETECEQWLCNNIYTHCNGVWNCAHGEDEIGCDLSETLNCSSDEHMCISPYTNQLVCLPISKANDGNVDCLVATDEPNLCPEMNLRDDYHEFYCVTSHSTQCLPFDFLCDGRKSCLHGDDEQFCVKNRTHKQLISICDPFYSSTRSHVEQFLCKSKKYTEKKRIVYFSLDGGKNSPKDTANRVENTKLTFSSFINKFQQQSLSCHRGLHVRLWLNNDNNLSTITCLCPPSYYGSRCQYQNQRISLSIQFRASSQSWQTPFAIIISLIDESDERIIHSNEQFTYLSTRDCQIKFNIYLLYSTRPKNQSKYYSIHIDIYEKMTLNYRGSLLMPIKFPFLPVHRLAFIIDIPRNNDSIGSCSNDQCHHGKCIRYFNNPQNTTFCQCDRGWTGRFCTIPYTCRCSSDSVCIGITSNNRSVCICPLHRFGPRCLLTLPFCLTNGGSTCENGGQCIPNDEYIESNQKFTCICPKGFIGKRCEIIENQILLSFGREITLPQSIFIHFIQVIHDDRPQRVTTLRTIPFKQDSIIIYWPHPFHLVFVEFSNKNYYLTVVQNSYHQSAIISKTINSSDRCRHIAELFNQTVIQLNLLRRIKYYQLPCQKYSSDLFCFYDDIHLCLCQQLGQQRLANCFEFDHNKTFNCLGQSVCENGAQCFQDAHDCPQRSMCVCPPCYYGAQCQFSTSRFSLSLDAILRYHIQPHLKITQQPNIVKISIVLFVVVILVGLINSTLTLITLKSPSLRHIGCDYYLLGASITSLLTTLMFGFKFWILILIQMKVIVNRLFLYIQCHSIDFILRCSSNMDQWLNACVAMEQAIAVIKDKKFNKKKSIQIAKLIVPILLIINIGTGLDDPIFRRLIDEENEDEKRVWCIVSYSSNLQMFNSWMNIFHFITPFLLNLISAILIVTKKSHKGSYIQRNLSYQQILREQIRKHKNLFIAPVVLVILAVPHLIFSYTSKCMKSADDSWLFLIGYLIPFIPPKLTFLIFILPSKLYRKEFQKTITQYRAKIRRFSCRNS